MKQAASFASLLLGLLLNPENENHMILLEVG
jgi:hypothetical protein